MRVPLAEVGRRARMDLIFAKQDAQTVLRHSYCEVPFKFTRLLNWRQPPAHLILMHSTAGIFGGDELESSIRVQRGARVLVTQQSAAKIHPSGVRPAVQRNHVFVEAGGELQLYLEPVIPFADSILRQTTRIDVERGGRLMFWEGFMAGRVGRGERWQFQELASETNLFLDGRQVYLDRFRLPTGLERSAWTMGCGNYWGTGLYVGEQALRIATMLHEKLPEAGVDTPSPEIAVMRIVSASGPEFRRGYEMFCESLSLWERTARSAG
jgi:urease accessory protein UreH